MKILIAVITFNEEKNIHRTLKDLHDNNFGYDIIVIDNGSFDKTGQICKDMGVNIVSHCINSGSSMGTVSTYFLYAYKNNYDIVCQFDGDGQHIASEIPKIIEPIKNEESDYVVGTRFITFEGFQSSFLRRVGIKFFSWLKSKIIGIPITDSTSGFRAYGKNVIEFFANKYKHEISDTNQLLLLSFFNGAKIKEVPIKMREREYGSSEFGVIKSIAFPFKGLIIILGCLLQRNQIH